MTNLEYRSLVNRNIKIKYYDNNNINLLVNNINNSKQINNINFVINKYEYLLFNMLIKSKEKPNKSLSITSVFDLEYIPKVKLSKYINNLCIYSNIKCSSTIIYSLPLIDKLLNKTDIYLSKLNVYTIVFTALCLSMKINEEYVPTDKSLAFLGMIDIKDYVFYESYFLYSINYNILIDSDEYNVYSTLFNNFNF